ncbi:MAG: ABC transporter substrate-binding protein [Microscillaceae bacterium]|nr:ABC transporter substrate-binding protein [Microscillaceae bacterium]
MAAKKEALQNEARFAEFKRLVCIGELMTDAVRAFGDSDRIVAIDRSYPHLPHLKLPKVGYKNTLKAAHLLRHKPDAIFSDWEGSPEEVVQAITQKKLPYFLYRQPEDVASLKLFLTDLGRKLNKPNTAKLLIRNLDKDLSEIRKMRKSRKDSLRVLYVHARGPQTMMFAGLNTVPDALIRMCGAKNAANDYENMERLDEEEIAYLNPDFILMSQQSFESFAVKIYQAVVLTKLLAYRLGRVIILEENELLNLGPGAGKVALKIAEKLYTQQYFEPLPLLPGPYSDEPGQNPAPIVKNPSKEIEIIDQN